MESSCVYWQKNPKQLNKSFRNVPKKCILGFISNPITFLPLRNAYISQVLFLPFVASKEQDVNCVVFNFPKNYTGNNDKQYWVQH